MRCGILEQRKAPGQERAEALDCPGNAANSKITRILPDRLNRLSGGVGHAQQGLGPTGCTRQRAD